MLKWLNKNRHTLLNLYRNQYVAYNDCRVIAHSENLRDVLELATASGETFAIYLVPRSTASIQILPIRFRDRRSWECRYWLHWSNSSSNGGDRTLQFEPLVFQGYR